MAKEKFENISDKNERTPSKYTEALFNELAWGDENVWDEYDKLPNTLAYEMIKGGKGDVVMVHVERFDPTKQLFESLIEDAIIQGYAIDTFIDYFKKLQISENMAKKLAEQHLLHKLYFNDFNFKISKSRLDELKKLSRKNEEDEKEENRWERSA